MSTPPGMAPRQLEPLDESTFQSVMRRRAPGRHRVRAVGGGRQVGQGREDGHLPPGVPRRGRDRHDAPGRGRAGREAEEIAAAKAVGVDIVDFLDFRDGVIEYGVPLRRELCKVMRMRRPDCVVSQGHDVRFMNRLSQSDHRAVGLATLDAVRDCGNRWIFSDLADEGIEPWAGSRPSSSASPVATHYVDVEDHLEPAIASLEAHHAYNDVLPADFPKPRELVTMILGCRSRRPGARTPWPSSGSEA